MTNDLHALLKKELQFLDDAARILKRSYEICLKISVKNSYSIDELDHFEALTARFARLSDIIIQKVFRLLDELELEPSGTIRDRINRAEKRGLINDSEIFVKIRLLRNDIAHEYMESALMRIFINVMEWVPVLLDTVEKIKIFSKKY